MMKRCGPHCDRQSKSNAPRSAVARGINAEERREDPCEILLRHARSVIVDRDSRGFPTDRQVQLHGGATRCISDRVLGCSSSKTVFCTAALYRPSHADRVCFSELTPRRPCPPFQSTAYHRACNLRRHLDGHRFLSVLQDKAQPLCLLANQ